MTDQSRLFHLFELTRNQPQYGFALSGVPKSQLPDIAQHHYVVSLVGWQLAKQVIDAGAHIDLARVLELCLIHNLGTLFGGDIAMPYAKANPAANTKAKEFEAENQRYFSSLFPDPKYYFGLFTDASTPTTDEARLTKIATYIEVSNCKAFITGTMTPGDIQMMLPRLRSYVSDFKDPIAKKVLGDFIETWAKESISQLDDEVFESAKSN